MSKSINKIDFINNMAVFQDFSWVDSIKNKDGNNDEFKKINIFYGRNYSGKTTLSRIFRALEIGSISDKYSSAEFQLSFSDGTIATQNALSSHGQLVRVFNEDFVKDNLRFIFDEEQPINSFAILGEDNAKVEKDIEKHETELGSEEEKSGLLGELLGAEEKYTEASKIYKDKFKELEKELRYKAIDRIKGIRYDKRFNDSNYNFTKIQADLKIVTKKTYSPPTDQQVIRYEALLKEESKPEISESLHFNLQYSKILPTARELIEKKIQASDSIQELLHDAALQMWVRQGREYHLNKRDKCAFCGNDLPKDLWEKLEKHFNEESEKHRQALDNLLELIELEQSRVPNLLIINKTDFSSSLNTELDSLEEQLSTQSTIYSENLNTIKEQVEKRKNDIFTIFKLDASESAEDDLNAVRDSYEQIRNDSNKHTDTLSTDQSKASNTLRLYEVFTYKNIINYEEKRDKNIALEKAMNDAEKVRNSVNKKVDTKQAKISELKDRLKDESKGADRVNYYLKHFFGHQFLSLKAIEDNSKNVSPGYRFEVTRNDEKAFHLSEGECNLIAFCYFVAKLEDVKTKGNQPIIWIDDPVSSLDANHIFFVYSIINVKIVKPDKTLVGKSNNSNRFKQLFISTHNLEFLKYLKRLPGAMKKCKSQYFIIPREDQVSDIQLMPEYMKEYVTEFNFLFHQIHKCAFAKINSYEKHDCYYNFGNNARKFLEVFLYFKYPNSMTMNEKLEKFFGYDSVSVSLTHSINNEFSHLKDVLERNVIHNDFPEMKTTAKFILDKIKKNDPHQYSALLQSIGVTEGLAE